jgi:hypothetical protein
MEEENVGEPEVKKIHQITLEDIEGSLSGIYEGTNFWVCLIDRFTKF